ncbi:sigma-70 family RNA polymerase sigma factor [Candidatus Hydrogenedentota bacterium]
MSDEELIAKVLAGEERLFAQLVERYSGFVWALCLSYVHNHSDCEDLVQDVFLQSYRRLDTITNRKAFAGWLRQVARRQCLQWLRRAKKNDEKSLKYRESSVVNDAATPEEHMLREEHYRVLLAKMGTLPRKYREALLLYHAEGNTVARSAELLGISPSAMKKRLQRGRTMLKERVGADIKPALASERHSNKLNGKILATIPFGNVAWLTELGTSATIGAKVGLIGGTILMWKKMIIGVGAILLMLLLVDVARDLKGTHDRKKQTVETVKTREAVSPPSSPLPRPEAILEPEMPVETAVAPVEGPLSERDVAPVQEPEVMVEPVKKVDFASISGLVSDTQGAPVAKVDVMLQIGRAGMPKNYEVRKIFSAITDSEGRYEINMIDTFGNGRVFTSIPGYMMKSQWLTLSVEPGMRRDDVNVTIREADHFIAGRVISENRQPILGAMVDIYESASGGKFDSTMTNEDGRFHISRVETSDEWYTFKVWKAGYGTGFFPQIAVDSDKVEFILRSAGRISGKVTTAAGRRIDDAKIEVMGEARYMDSNQNRERVRELGPLETYTDAEGNYVMDNLSEDFIYIVAVSRSDEGIRGRQQKYRHQELSKSSESLSLKRDIRVASGRETSGVNLILFGEARLYGKVEYEPGGQPAYPVKVCLSPVHPHVTYGHKYSCVTKPDGSYSITLPIDEDKKFFVFFEYVKGTRVQDAVVGSVDVIPARDRVFDFTVPAPFALTASLVDETGSPVTGVRARIAVPGRRGFLKNSKVDEDGRAEFSGIPPYVSFRVEALENSSSPRDRASGLVIGRSEPIIGAPGERVDDVLVVCAAGIGGIRGIIVDTDGNPVADAEITCRVPDDEGTNRKIIKAKTDSEGAFLIPKLFSEGQYPRIQVLCWRGRDLTTREDWRGAVNSVEVAADEVTDLGVVTVKLHPNKWRDSGFDVRIDGPLTPEFEDEFERMLNQSANS